MRIYLYIAAQQKRVTCGPCQESVILKERVAYVLLHTRCMESENQSQSVV